MPLSGSIPELPHVAKVPKTWTVIFCAPCQCRSLAGQEHGRTIPLSEVETWVIVLSLIASRLRNLRDEAHLGACGVILIV